MTGAGSVKVGVLSVEGVLATDAAEVTDAVGLGLCLGRGLGRGRSDAFNGANWDTSSTLTLWGAVCVTTAATGVGLTGGVAAWAGVWWSTARATRKAAPNAATMQINAVPASRTDK